MPWGDVHLYRYRACNRTVRSRSTTGRRCAPSDATAAQDTQKIPRPHPRHWHMRPLRSIDTCCNLVLVVCARVRACLFRHQLRGVCRDLRFPSPNSDRPHRLVSACCIAELLFVYSSVGGGGGGVFFFLLCVGGVV